MGICGVNINKRKEDIQINNDKKDRVKECILKDSSPLEKISDDFKYIKSNL